MSENVHTMYDLAQMQSLSLSSKISMTKQRIRQWYDAFDGMVYVSFSGGKDSTVLLHIAREVYPDIPALYIDTGLEYPEIRDFVKKFDNVDVRYPIAYDKKSRTYKRITFKEVITTYGYPFISKEVSKKVKDARSAIRQGKEAESYACKMFDGTWIGSRGQKSFYDVSKWKFLLYSPYPISSKCCDVMKKNPAHQYEKETGRKPITGQMANESRLRKSQWIQYGCNAFGATRQISNPMSFWTENDVLTYLLTYLQHTLLRGIW